jgi:hypothetical protein
VYPPFHLQESDKCKTSRYRSLRIHPVLKVLFAGPCLFHKSLVLALELSRNGIPQARFRVGTTRESLCKNGNSLLL